MPEKRDKRAKIPPMKMQSKTYHLAPFLAGVFKEPFSNEWISMHYAGIRHTERNFKTNAHLHKTLKLPPPTPNPLPSTLPHRHHLNRYHHASPGSTSIIARIVIGCWIVF
ncbi:hypothetical protein CEXT_252601 [Caerostris extrusa]|uniref:Uncharacterized protein n=1 Tax=Caerostris extrusa TaxID=172846 RepID=A0AAV4MWD3_CAEEX|nr:hypothetical protein CEXT_252601 [Caerostris extrusa]